MEKQLFETDESIIIESLRLYGEYSPNEKCYNELNALKNKISHEKRDMWEKIIEAMLCSLKGDGIGLMRSFDNKEDYLKAYEIYNSLIDKIEDKNSLLFLFVEKKRITNLALSFKKSINDIITLYDNVINKFKNNKNDDFLIQVSGAMLNKSFVLWKYYENNNDDKLLNEAISVNNELINQYKHFNSPYILGHVVIALNNKVNDLEKLNERNAKKQRKILDNIITQYNENKNAAIQVQVSKAMFNKVISLYTIYITEDAKQQKGLSIEQKNNYSEQVLDSCRDLRKHFKQSDNIIIQQNVMSTIGIECKILQQQGKQAEALDIYTDCINNYKNISDEIINYYVTDTMINKAELLENMENIDEAINEYERIIERINNSSNKNFNIKYDESIIEFDYNNYVVIAEYKIQKLLEKKEYINECKVDEQIKKEYEENKKRIDELIAFYPENERNIDELIDLIRHNKIIPFIGAGLSKFAKYPLWSEFLDSIFEKYKDRERIKNKLAEHDFYELTCAKKASILKDCLQQAIFGREIRDIFKEKTIHEESFVNEPIYILPDLFRDLILTTNFDKLIERAYDYRLEKHIVSCSINDINKLDDIRSDTLLYKLHGTIDEPGKIILTQEEYNKNYEEGTPHYNVLNKYVRGKNILFIGCGLSEDDELIPFYKNSKNFAIYPSKKDTEPEEYKLSARNILSILFPIDDFSYIKDILEYIRNKI
jgi:tetratricopeptide (TPR) repeat protein